MHYAILCTRCFTSLPPWTECFLTFRATRENRTRATRRNKNWEDPRWFSARKALKCNAIRRGDCYRTRGDFNQDRSRDERKRGRMLREYCRRVLSETRVARASSSCCFLSRLFAGECRARYASLVNSTPRYNLITLVLQPLLYQLFLNVLRNSHGNRCGTEISDVLLMILARVHTN